MIYHGCGRICIGEFASRYRAGRSVARKPGTKGRPEAEKSELAQIYVGRGGEPTLALQVASQLMAKDALAAHAKDASFYTIDGECITFLHFICTQYMRTARFKVEPSRHL
jgi:hypothetical protein